MRTAQKTGRPRERSKSDKKYEEKRAGQRHLSWSFFVWPDSAPEKWRSTLDDLHVQWAESPLHDKDVNEDGTPKKPHWHILVIFDSVKSYDQVKEITDSLKTTIPQPASSARGLIRYMTHMDNPEKAQYDAKDIVAHGGLDVDALLKPTSAFRYQMICEMCDFITDNECTNYLDFFNHARKNHLHDWIPLLCDNSSYIISKFIDANWQKHNSKSTVNIITKHVNDVNTVQTTSDIVNTAQDIVNTQNITMLTPEIRNKYGLKATMEVSPWDKNNLS